MNIHIYPKAESRVLPANNEFSFSSPLILPPVKTTQISEPSKNDMQTDEQYDIEKQLNTSK